VQFRALIAADLSAVVDRLLLRVEMTRFPCRAAALDVSPHASALDYMMGI
jgi:hypothetical protein